MWTPRPLSSAMRAPEPNTAVTGQIQYPVMTGLRCGRNREVRGQVHEPATGLSRQVSSSSAAQGTNTTTTAKIIQPITSLMPASVPNATAIGQIQYLTTSRRRSIRVRHQDRNECSSHN